MNSEVLERLLIDRDAGELSCDVEELLEDHLRQNAGARKEAAEISETLHLARVALGSDPVVALPVKRLPWAVSSLAWAMAACLLCAGLVVTLAILDRTGPHIRTSVAGSGIAAAPTGEESDFWSAYRVRASLSSSRPNMNSQILWKSPVRKPELPK
jgi:hypothetical protein